MKEFDDLLGGYGFEFVVPKRYDGLKSYIKYNYSDPKIGKAYEQIMELIENNVRLKVKDIDKVYRVFDLPKEYNKFKKITEIDMGIYVFYDSKQNKTKFYMTDNELVEALESKVMENPERYGLNKKEVEIVQLFACADTRRKKAEDWIFGYYKTIDFINASREDVLEKMMKEVSEVLSGKTLCTKWLEEKLK